MKLATFLPEGSSEPVAGEVRGGQIVAFSSGTVLDRLATGDRTPADGAAYDLDTVTLLAPVRSPRAIFGIGLNYAAHAAETGAELPEAPMVFLKLPSSSVPGSGPVRTPPVVQRLARLGRLDRAGRARARERQLQEHERLGRALGAELGDVGGVVAADAEDRGRARDRLEELDARQGVGVAVGGGAIAGLQALEDRPGGEGDDLLAPHFSGLCGGFALGDEGRELHGSATLSRLDR